MNFLFFILYTHHPVEADCATVIKAHYIHVLSSNNDNHIYALSIDLSTAELRNLHNNQRQLIVSECVTDGVCFSVTNIDKMR